MRHLRRYVFLLIFTFLSLPVLHAKVKAYFQYLTFYIPGETPYLETYLSVNGKSVKYVKDSHGQFKATLEIVLILKNKDRIVSFNKYNLHSPVYTEKDSVRKDFLDHQKMIVPANGLYELELQIKDKNSSEPAVSINQILEVNYDTDKIHISDILPLSSISKSTDKSAPLYKNGYIIMPYLSNYYDEYAEGFAFYAEIYNARKLLGENEKFLVKYYIADEKMNPLANYHGFSKQTALSVNVILGNFGIKDLPTGNYYFVIEVRNKSNEKLAEKFYFFIRKNNTLPTFDNINEDVISASFVSKISNPDSLKYFIAALQPIAKEGEYIIAVQILKENDMDKMRRYFYGFWYQRNPENPEKAWMEYKKQLDYVDRAFSTQIRRGYETDRGRVYLRYGPPNTISNFPHEPSSYPYQIWHYYKIDQYTNRRFVFYNTDLSSGDYELLHSDMFGEINTPNWEKVLQKRTETFYDPYDEKGVKHYGGNSEEFFKNPR
ncbi:MAG: hypothetical protein KatS3mg034_0874 [Vicingaceae bacterium]|nr:MAG: hypothetical protein KatS3mg034_0874 [Vicingaceae bacterium]